MRIVHTSDWHAGRVWKGISRLDELEAALASLATFVEDEHIDLVLLSGDVFDSGAPAGEAERVVFRTLKRIGQSGARTVVIAGNHDNPVRIEAWGTLAELVGVHALGRPARAERGGVVRIDSRSGEPAIVAALPFASVRNLISARELADSDTAVHQTYADAMGSLFSALSESFRDDAVNLVVSHTLVDGAAFTRIEGSERPVHLGESWATSPQMLPTAASYIALGHIHRPQALPSVAAPAEYAGSPLQMDFGEAGEEKSFVLIEASPGLPATRARVPYRGARPLAKIRVTLPEIESRKQELDQLGWLRVEVPVDRPDPDLANKVKRQLERAVVVHPVLPVIEGAPEAQESRMGAPPAEIYRAYYRQTHQGIEPSDNLVTAFVGLWELAEHRDAEP
ncbi:MAG: exonuclease SbcCD subunit D [Deltaproteobacteria bacterium]|nr:exonuclease SbcCD subunit D [Deltaproteobacteria bacterium]